MNWPVIILFVYLWYQTCDGLNGKLKRVTLVRHSDDGSGDIDDFGNHQTETSGEYDDDDDSDCLLLKESGLDPSGYVPQCTANGQFETKQCHQTVGECWCVKKSGQEIPGTRRRTTHIDCSRYVDQQHLWISGPLKQNNNINNNPKIDDVVLLEGTDKNNKLGKQEYPVDISNSLNNPNKHGEAEKMNEPSRYHQGDSIMSRPWMMAAIIGSVAVGLVCAILMLMFLVYRMRKKDEGSYALDEPKSAPSIGYTKARGREFFA